MHHLSNRAKKMPMKSRILIAEDDRALGAFLQRALLSDGHEVSLFTDGESAANAIEIEMPDLTLLDLGLPKRDGSNVLQFLRRMSHTAPVLILTGESNLDCRIRCFDQGADDCMLKPFSLRELRARCFALLRRQTGAESVLRSGDLELNRVDHSVRRNGQTITLTNKEYGLLECLMLNKGKCVSRNLLMEQVWKLSTEASTNVVDVYVNYLRRKLLETREEPVISTVRGQGYRIGTISVMQSL
jgi:DNA-binding response OmpR family regulator